MTAFTNNLKTAFLLALLFGLLAWAGYALGGSQGLLIGGAFGVIVNFSAWFFSDKIAVAAMRGRQVDDRSAPELYRMVESLAKRAGLPMPKVYVCPQQAPNAFATGRNPNHAAVAVTVGALQLLNREELEGVLAHELAHIKNRDTLTLTIAATIAGIFSTLAYWSMFLGPGVAGNNREGGHPFAAMAVILFGALGATLIKLAISRSREYVADADGASIAGSPHGLASALRKLDAMAKRVPMHNPNPAMNNMFIVEPAMGLRTLTSLFATHPPTERRIAALLRG